MIRIIDCGSQLTQNIARRVRELGVFTEIVPFHKSLEEILKGNVEGLIISGGQFSVYDKNAPMYVNGVLFSHLPILGICYGQQSIAHMLGGNVKPAMQREYGETKIQVIQESPLFEDIPEREFAVWMSHGDIVEQVPSRFDIIAKSQNGHIAAMQRNSIYAVQFHPEVDHTKYGRRILENFLNICKAKRTWDPSKEFERIVEIVTDQVKDKMGIGGISGGVDSTAASILINRISGHNYHPIFVDNGLLRLNEADDVQKFLAPFNLNIRYINASEHFISKLRGVTDPDKKRRVIGNEFIAVFEEEAKRISDIDYLVQGTLYPDVIESVPIYGTSSKIKRHHNVGGLPEKMNLELVEPWRNLFKDEVRKIAEARLEIPKEIVWRHPFPGPGLAVRIRGEVTKEKLDLLRKVDAIFIDELEKRNLYYKMSQAFSGLTESKSTGVMGDEGTYEAEIRLRAVVTNDFMTSDIYQFNWNDLQVITNRIVNEVKGINRVFYDITQKPPATIEWE